MRVAVIGGGAAGFFAAIQAKTNYPAADVFLLEKTSKLLSKVKVSGGGRCNVTNGTSSIAELSRGYPRGAKLLKKLFATFQAADTREWFESRGVQLKTESDNRVFPVTDSSQTIIDCLMQEAKKLRIKICTKVNVVSLNRHDNFWKLQYAADQNIPQNFDFVIIATGGSPKRSNLEWLEQLGHAIVDPVPSLFTANIPSDPIRELMGVSVPEAIARVQGTKLESQGPILITHWGMSGPAILKLSAFGARELADREYKYVLQINWTGIHNHDLVRQLLVELKEQHSRKQMNSVRPFSFTNRFWDFLLQKAEIKTETRWNELPKKSFNKLVAVLTRDEYQVHGKTAFKEEFVTCGGVSLDSINPKTLESKSCPNLFFAGEVLDIDGITGGYNFQAAWTTGFIAGRLENKC